MPQILFRQSQKAFAIAQATIGVACFSTPSGFYIEAINSAFQFGQISSIRSIRSHGNALLHFFIVQ